MEEVRNWLRGLGLEQYAPNFEAEGWDTLEMLEHMKDSEIESCITKIGHRRKFEIGFKTHPPAPKRCWTKGNEARASESSKMFKEDPRNIDPCQGLFQTSKTDDVAKCIPSVWDGKETIKKETGTHTGSLGDQMEESQDPRPKNSMSHRPISIASVKDSACMSGSKGPPSLVVNQANPSNDDTKGGLTGSQEQSCVDDQLHVVGDNEGQRIFTDTLVPTFIDDNPVLPHTDENQKSIYIYAVSGLGTIPDKNGEILLTSGNTRVISAFVSLEQVGAANHKGPTVAASDRAITYIDENQKETPSNENQGQTNVDDSNVLTPICDSGGQTHISVLHTLTNNTECHGVLPVPSSSYIGETDETITCAQLPLEISLTAMNPEEKISAESFGCNTHLVDTVCVKGARNKIIKTPQNTKNEQTSRKVYPQSFLVVKDSLEKFEQRQDFLLKGSSTNYDNDNSSELDVDEDLEVTVCAHPQMMCNSGGTLTKATIVKNSQNVTVAGKAEVHHHVHKAKVKNQRYNFKDQILNVVQSYKKKDHLFVETNAYREVEEILADSQWALITGKPGDGKTAMAAHLLIKYKEKGFEPLIVTNAQDWKEMVKGTHVESKKDKQFVMIDDIFGSMIVDDRKVHEWMSLIDIMHRVVVERKESLVVICTSRTYIFKDVKSKMERFSCFRNKTTVDLTEEKHALTNDEKAKIWTNYTSEYNVMSVYPECIYTNIKSPHGFPHCVELYCSNHFFRAKGIAFFENPMEYVCQEIQNFKENDKIKYCLLLLILYNKNKLEETRLQEICLSEPPKEILRVFKAAGVSSDYAQSELKKALNSLMNTYVCKNTDHTYSFSHESIRENVAFNYIKENPLHAIEDIDIKYLVDYTRYAGHKQENKENIFVLPFFCVNTLVARTVKEIKSGTITLVCQHQAWESLEFVRKWLSYVSRQSSGHGSDTNYINDIFCATNNFKYTINSMSNWYSDHTFLETLMYYQRESAVLEILNNEHIIRHLKASAGTLLSRALVCTCVFLPSVEATRTLLSLKANPNMRDMVGCTCLTRLLCSRSLEYMSLLYIRYVGGDLYKETLLQFHSFFWDAWNKEDFLTIVANTEISYSVDNKDCYQKVEHLNNIGLDILQTLLSSGADPNLSDISGKTPLHHFVLSPLADIFICPAIRILINCGANVNFKDCEGMTPLMACTHFPGRKSMRLNALIAAGANINQTDNFGSDAIEYGKMAFGTMLNMTIK